MHNIKYKMLLVQIQSTRRKLKKKYYYKIKFWAMGWSSENHLLIKSHACSRFQEEEKNKA